MRIKSVVPVALLLAAFSVSFSGAALAQKPESEGDKQYDKKHDKKHDNEGDKKSDKAADSKHGHADEKWLEVQGAGESAHNGQSLHLLAPLASQDRDHIRQYLRTGDAGFEGQPDGQGKHKPLPPGLQNKLDRGGELPPGWQKKVARGEVLEPDLRRHAQRLPDDLNRGLHGYDAGTELLFLEDRVVRVATGQGTVLDVIDIADILVR
jgi:Ni/Co efflux regulator RcnB